jgi:hypothetical protein
MSRDKANTRKASTSPPAPDDAVVRSLASYYQRNGVLRTPNANRRKNERQRYHKGYEIRLLAFDARELAEIRRLLRAAGFRFGQPYVKVHRKAQPIYGKAQVTRFLELVRASWRRRAGGARAAVQRSATARLRGRRNES